MPSLSSARVALLVLSAIALSVATLPSSATAAESAAESVSSSSAAGTAAAAADAAAPTAAAPAVAADAPIVGHWCNAFPHVVIAIDAAGRVEMDGEGRHVCELLTGAREVRCTYRHIEGRVHLYKLKPGVDDKGRADPQQMQMEMSLEHATEYHSLRLCEEETIASARAPRGQNGGRANEYVPQLGSRTWSVEGESESRSRMYSRRLHRTNWSERNSKLGALSLAIGRGFQLGYRTPKEIRSALIAVGLKDETALKVFEGASGLSGVEADQYMFDEKHFKVEITAQMERALFAEQYAQATRDSMRRFGGRQWNELPATVQEFVLDLQFAHFMTDAVFARLRHLLAEKNWAGMLYLVSDTDFWLEVGVTRQRNLMHQHLLQHILVHAQAAQQVGTRAHADEL